MRSMVNKHDSCNCTRLPLPPLGRETGTRLVYMQPLLIMQIGTAMQDVSTVNIKTGDSLNS